MKNKLYFSNQTSILALCLLTLLLQGCGEHIDARQVVVNNGLIYKLHATEPFSGTLEKYTLPYNETHKLATSLVMAPSLANCTVPVKDGIRDGVTICKSDGGAKVAELDFKDGIRVGTEKRWDATTGKLIMEAEWQNTNKLLKEQNFDPATGNKIYEATWINAGEVRHFPDGEAKYFDISGKLTNHFTYKNGFGTDSMAAQVANTLAVTPTTSIPEVVAATNSIKVIGTTADGKYPIYQLEGDLGDLNYSSPGLIWQPGDLIDHMAYLAPEDVNKGYSCDWVCKDDANHIVGLNPQNKPLSK